MKILLGYPPVTDEYEKNRDSGLAPHLSLLCLAAHVREEIEGLEIRIVDGHHCATEEIKEVVRNYKPDLVGLSVDFTNYKNAVELAEICNQRGAKVILGSNHASNLYEEILNRRKNIDAIVCNDGEDGLVGYIKFLQGQIGLEKVSNLAYRKNGQVFKNQLKIFNLEKMRAPAYDLVNMDDYFLNQRAVFGSGFRMLQFTSQRGCVNFPLCAFCGRYPDGYRCRRPEDFAKEVLKYISEYNLNEVWDRSDSFLQIPDWVKRFRREIYKFKNNPFKSGGVSFKTYSRADQLMDLDVVKALKDLNFRIVFIGYEAGDDRILKNVGKHSNLKTYYQATKNVLEAGIQIDASFILGLPGENRESLENHINFVKQLVKIGLRKIRINRLLVLPGTPLFKKVTEWFSEYRGVDTYDMSDCQDKLFLTDLYDLKGFGNSLDKFKQALEETALEMASVVTGVGGCAEGYGHGKDKMILLGTEYEKQQTN